LELRASWVCPDPEETAVFPEELALPEKLVELDPPVLPEAVDPLETSAWPV